MATTYLSPVGNSQQVDANGAPLNGGQIWTYQAGTTTLIATYMDNSGAVGQQNPIPLNTLGLPSNPIWLPAGQAVKFVIQDANGVTQRTVDNVTGINDPSGASTADQWVIYQGASLFVSTTSLALVGDQTGTFHPGRRIRTVNTGGTVYSSITASSYNSGTGRTTVTVTNDSGVLDSGLSQVSYGLLSFANPSMPGLQALLSGSGYQKLPSGLIVQWGAATAGQNGTSVSNNFPIPFTASPYVVVPVHIGTDPSVNVVVDSTASPTASAFSLRSNYTASNVQCYFIAIGK